MKLRLLIALSALLLASFLAHAQAFEPGLLVRSTGDTLHGEIENGFWVEPPAFIRFRPNSGSASQLFQPRQLRAVNFTNGRYFRYEALPIDHAASTQLSSVVANARTDVRVDSLLAEVLLDGPATLWRVVRPGSTHYLVRRTGQPILDLCERSSIRQLADGTRQLVDANNYRSQLAIYFGDCPAAVAKAQAASFSAPGIAAVVQAYHDACQAAGAPVKSWLTQATPRRRTAWQGGLLGGARYNYIRPFVDNLPETPACVDCQVRPYVGLYTEVSQSGRTAALYGELTVSTFSNQRSEYLQINSFVSYYVVSYRAWLASARLGLRFFFPLPHEQQWLLSLGYELNKSWQPTVTARAGNAIAPPDNQLGYELPSLLPNLGIGWRSKRLTLGLDGQLYTSPAASGFLGFITDANYTVRAGLSYRLGRNPDVAAGAAAQ